MIDVGTRSPAPFAGRRFILTQAGPWLRRSAFGLRVPAPMAVRKPRQLPALACVANPGMKRMSEPMIKTPQNSAPEAISLNRSGKSLGTGPGGRGNSPYTRFGGNERPDSGRHGNHVNASRVGSYQGIRGDDGCWHDESVISAGPAACR